MRFIDPVCFAIGPFKIYWYSLAYIFGIILANIQANRMIATYKLSITNKDLDNLIGYIIIGIILGGRLGYVLLFEPMHYMRHFFEIFKIWEGGMSFHGGVIGVIIAILLFCRKTHRSFFSITDLAASCSLLGVFLGRIGNFINQEHPGRETTVPWGIIYPMVDDKARHPSQLYEALGEGFLLWLIIWFVYKKFHKKEGTTSAFYLIGYGAIRFFLEYFRTPDGFISYLTIGQFLSVLTILVGCLILRYKRV